MNFVIEVASSRYWKENFKLTYNFRHDPVPFTGGKSNRIFRYAKTTNEQRQYYACENSEIVRACRNPTHLASAWDDYMRHIQQNWKHQSKRKKQHGYDQRKLRRLKSTYKWDDLIEKKG